jgi:Protein of unknown function (DUF3515)
VAVIAAFALGRSPGNGGTPAPSSSAVAGPLPPITTVPAPSATGSAVESACAKVISALPVQLGPLAARPIQTERAVAWGDPPVVLRCGVARPAALTPGSTAEVGLTGGVYWLRADRDGALVYTSIDRAVYIEVSVPKNQTYLPLATLGMTIATQLPPVCAVPEPNQPQPADDQLCTHRP